MQIFLGKFLHVPTPSPAAAVGPYGFQSQTFINSRRDTDRKVLALVMWLPSWPRVTTPGASREATPRVFEQRSVSARSPVATFSVSQRANERCVSPPRRNPPRRRPFFAASHKRDNWPHQATSGVPSPGARAVYRGRRRARDSYGVSYAYTDVRSSCFRREEAPFEPARDARRAHSNRDVSYSRTSFPPGLESVPHVARL